MSRFSQRFHLTCAIVGTLTCILWSVLTILAVFQWHTVRPRVRLALLPLAIGVVAVMEFNFYKGERKSEIRQ